MTTRKRKKSLSPQSESASDQTDGEPLKRLIQCQSATKTVDHHLSPHFSLRESVRLCYSFFSQPCADLAKAFLGKVLVRKLIDGTELRGRVVETEAYLGGEDKASHSAGGKRTERNTAMFMKPGTIYVYPIYGIYLCMNVSSQGEGAAVLLRSLEPLSGQDVMRGLRAAKRKAGAKILKEKELCNGPSKLCQALNIQRCFDRRDLATDTEVWLERDPERETVSAGEVVSVPRIGVESHGEWATKPLRFYLRGHPCVSVLNRDAERQMQSSIDLHNIEMERTV
ncbi:DNA-3-methyladenine glycosylase [Sinocyclocheilus rhinocerous]|uniref:DNA-3-methyladenine glycosylase n=1 Tax=Sinocyclocheilus rhinocerous TaxID=307959 RepID=A0A673M7G5_9TELE|nr:PREDICTED: DNA-3-methyladenine glycosylase-like [Sinocyclocheilus rhinocerous]